MKPLLLTLFIFLSSCAGLKLKDMNKISAGMSKPQVIDILGEPNNKKMTDGKEIFEYELKDETGDLKPRIVVFEDREVVFFGKPSEFKANPSTAESSNAGNHNTNTNTVSPTINITAPNVTVSPVIHVTPTVSPKPDNDRKPSSGSTYFHPAPTINELQNATLEPK